MVKEIEELLMKATGNNKEALEAMFFLARIYTHGMYGEEKNLEKAKCWSNKAKELEQKLLKNASSNSNTSNISNTINNPGNTINSNTSKEKPKFDNSFSDRFRNLQFNNTNNVNNTNTNDINNKTNNEQTNVKNNSPIIGESRSFDFDADEINKKLKDIFIKKEITEESEINKIKKRLSLYSNSVPIHDLKDLGDKINIISALELPLYKITLKSHYEIRKLEEGTKPYRGEKIPKKLLNREDVDVWTFNTQQISSVKDFEEKEQDFTIVASQEVERCSSCHGQGENICDDCHGQGENICDDCHGQGEIRCSKCGGKGEVRCSSCSGHGYKIDSEGKRSSCWWCHGTGYVKCSSCNNGYNTCYHCDGKGRVTCYMCGGKGRVTCYMCDGQGEVINFLYIHDTLQNRKFIEIINNEQYPQKMISGEKSNIYDKDGLLNKKEGNEYLTEEELKKKYPLEYESFKHKMKKMDEELQGVLDLCDKYGLTLSLEEKKKKEELEYLKENGFVGYYYKNKTNKIIDNKEDIDKLDNSLIRNQKEKTIIDFKNNTIPDSLLDSLDTNEYILLKRAFSRVLSNSKKISDFGILNTDYKILKQHINISKINVVCVKYKYQNNEYTIWLYGDNYSFVYVEKSPITEIYNDYIEQSENLLKQKQYSKALEFIDKCILMKPKDETTIKLRKEIIDNIKHQYWIGGLISGLSLLPASFLYVIVKIDVSTYIYPLLGEIIWAILISLGIGFLIGIISNIIHSTSIKKTFKRYLMPIIYSFIISLIYTATCLCMNNKDYYIDCFYYRTRNYDRVLQRNSNNEFKMLSQSEILEKAFNEYKNDKTNESLKKVKDELFIYHEILNELKSNLKNIKKSKKEKIETEEKILKEIKIKDDYKDIFSEVIENWKNGKLKTTQSLLQKMKTTRATEIDLPYNFSFYSIAVELIKDEISMSQNNKSKINKKR